MAVFTVAVPLILLAGWGYLPVHLLSFTADRPLPNAGLHGTQEDEQQDEFLGALAALGGSAGNGQLREVLEWDEATNEAERALLHQAFHGVL